MTERIQYREILKECQEKYFKEGEPVSSQELGMYSLVKPEVKIGYWWGSWKLGAQNALFCYEPEGKYENPVFWIDLEKLSSSATVLNHVFEVVNKKWANAEVLANLLWALEDIFNPQRNICTGGTDQTFNAETYLENLQDINN